MNRRNFVKYASSFVVLLANGKVIRAAQLKPGQFEENISLRFVVASDGHFGQQGTEYNNYFREIVERINEAHAKEAFAFCVINGDIIHDDKTHFPAAKQALDKLTLQYFVSQGNHDHVTPAEWEAIWNIPVNHDFSIGENSFLLATTSDEKGTYLCPDIDWISAKLKQYDQQKNVFVFLHINPTSQTKYGLDCVKLVELFAKHKNVRAVFNGHDHNEDGIKMKNQLPFIFDAHFGGDWGTSYRGFRVVELMKDNSLVTYIMNPSEKINETVA